jgi:predicted metalloprotease with PDZ domain
MNGYKSLLLVLFMGAAALTCVGCATGRDETAGVAAMERTVKGNGILINEILEDSAAQRAGLRQGDVIVSYEGTMITDPSFVERDIASSPMGRNIQMTIVRNGKLMRVYMPIVKKESRVINVSRSRKRPDYAVRLIGDYLWLGSYPYPYSVKDLENWLHLMPLAMQPGEEPLVPFTVFSVIVR